MPKNGTDEFKYGFPSKTRKINAFMEVAIAHLLLFTIVEINKSVKILNWRNMHNYIKNTWQN